MNCLQHKDLSAVFPVAGTESSCASKIKNIYDVFCWIGLHELREAASSTESRGKTSEKTQKHISSTMTKTI